MKISLTHPKISDSERRLIELQDRTIRSFSPMTIKARVMASAMRSRIRHAQLTEWVPDGDLSITRERRKVGEGVIAQLVGESADATVICWDLAAGVVTTPHTHDDFTETFFVASGHLRAVVDGDTHDLRHGDILEVRPGQLHEGVTILPSIIISTARPPLK